MRSRRRREGKPTYKPGDAVYYTPRPGLEYPAIVDSHPWCLGCGTWVMNLELLGDDYRATGRTCSRVNAAGAFAVRPRVSTEEVIGDAK